MIASEFVEELREKLRDRFHFPPEVVDEAVGLVRANSEVVEWLPLPAPVCRDADDDSVLASAIAGRCEFVVTGDKDLLALGSYERIEIVSPSAWMEHHVAE
jgi:putative PIN family toxin of toxin-antitoxin system